MNKPFITIILITVAVIGGLMFYQGKNSSSTQETGTDATTSENSYRSEAYKFKVALPEGFRTSAIPDESAGGETILLQGTDEQVQIYVMPFDEDITLTADRVRADIPDITMKNDRQLAVSGASAKALVFDGEDESFGPTHEAWIVHGGFLYQLKSRLDAGAVLDQVLKTWQFIR
jgi:hypothetical protein